MSDTARKWVPDEIVTDDPSLVIPLQRSLRLLTQGMRIGWVEAMMESRPKMQRYTDDNPELRAAAEARYAKLDRETRAYYEKLAEAKYPIPTGSAA